MPVSEDRLIQYRNRRQERLGRLTGLRSAAAGPSRAWYVAGELLVVDEDRRVVEQYIAGQRDVLATAGDEEVVPGLRRYHAPGLDVPDVIRAVRGALPAGANAAAPNHVLLSAPFNHGGPFGPPVPAAAAALAPPASGEQLVPVSIIDTGLWKDHALPTGFLTDRVDIETRTDVDRDGVLDGDVGHANFIAGVIVGHTDRAALSVLRVLDTFGVCTEFQLARALDRLDRSTRVVNLSLGGFTPQNITPVGLRVAVENALTVPDRVVLAAAGNDANRSDPFWPAAFARSGPEWTRRIAAVAAHDGTNLCEWSNAGPWVTLAAPGQDVHSTFINHTDFPSGWALWSGTSFATPRVVADVVAAIAAGRSAPAALDHVVSTAPASFRGYPALLTAT